MKKNRLRNWLESRNDMIISEDSIDLLLTSLTDHPLDRQTSKDLLLNDYFETIDKAITTPGRNILYAIMRAPLNSTADITSRSGFIAKLADDTDLLSALEKILWKVKYNTAQSFDAVLFKKTESRFTREKQVIMLLLFVFLVIAIPLLYSQIALYSILAFLIISFFVFARNLSIYNTAIPGFIMLGAHYSSAQKIIRLFNSEGIEDPHIDRLAGCLPRINRIIPTLKVLSTGSYTSSDPLQMLLFWLKNIFCIDLAAYSNAVEILNRDRESFIRFYTYYGTIDALAAAGRFLKSEPAGLCSPEFRTDSKIKADKIYHPLIPDAVSNDTAMDGCLILTGSNMSGKSTFLRTIGLNAVLAQSLGYCYAESFSMPLLNIVSIINKQDSMRLGESFYFYEAKRISEMLNRDDSRKYLFLIDELLSGTNSLERVSASVSIIKYLLTIENIISIVATHDVSIAQSLSNSCDCFYVSDVIRNGNMEFDYKLKRGIIKTTNAIRMLKILGLPEEITREAEKKVRSETPD